MATIKPKKNYTTIITVNDIVSSFYNSVMISQTVT